MSNGQCIPLGPWFSVCSVPGLVLGDNIWDGSASVDQQKVKHGKHLTDNLAGVGGRHSKVGK